MMKALYVVPAVCALLVGLTVPVASVLTTAPARTLDASSLTAAEKQDLQAQTFANTSTAVPSVHAPLADLKLRIHPVVSKAVIMAYAKSELTPQFVVADQQYATDHAAAQSAVDDLNKQLAAVARKTATAQKQSLSKSAATRDKAMLTLDTLGSTTADLKTQQAAAAKALAKLKTKPTVKQWGCLVQLWDHESGWDVYAKNPKGGAYGIPQSLPAKKMSVQAADWQYNYKTQIDWGLTYIQDRYQTPCDAWKIWQKRSPHWY